jgi:cell division initiation protein
LGNAGPLKVARLGRLPDEDTQGRGQTTLEISPLDIRNQVFSKKMRGYDPDEVKQFLDAVADRMEQLLKKMEGREKEVVALREKTDAYGQMEQNLRDTLLTAQKIGTDAKANAEQTAQNVLKEAELEARRRIAEATMRVEGIERHHDILRSETMALVAKLRSLAEAQISFLDGIEEEVMKREPSAGQNQ